jgi:hypothetical protein
MKYRFIHARATAAALAATALLVGCGGGPSGNVTRSLGGSVTGLMPGNSITLTNHGDSVTVGADGRFTFTQRIAEGGAYRVELAATTPNAQPCTSTYGVGTMGEHSVANVTVICGLPGGPGTFTASGTMDIARVDHSATLLANGNVLIAAGFNADSFAPPAELYDAASGAIRTTGTPMLQRLAHTATRLPNGKVLMAGGFEWTSGLEIAQSSAELYDPVTGVWTPTGSMDTARAWHTATLLPDGRVLIVGGRNTLGGTLAGAELYDPATEKWSNLRTMRDSRSNHAAVLLPDGQVLISGGVQFEPSRRLLDTSELFDPAKGEWSVGARMAHQRAQHSATLLPAGQVLIVGGSGADDSVELYSPTAGTFTAGPALANGRRQHSATLLPTGRVLVAGGEADSGSLDSVELYDPAARAWTLGPPMLRARENHTATLLINGKLLISGGSDNGDHLEDTELFH